MANPTEEFMHHITFAKLVILCVRVCVCVPFEKAVTGGQVFPTVLLATVASEPNTICEIGFGRSSEVAQH